MLEFLLAFEKKYGGFFDTNDVEPIKVCMSSSAGKPWKKSNIQKKRDFYDKEEHEDWLLQYITYVHCCNWRENFSAAPKGELTDSEDIKNQKSRVFYVAGVINDYYASFLCKDFNAALKRMPWNSCGEVWQYGGFLEFGKEIEKVIEANPTYFIEESDCSKYDLTAIPFFFQLCVLFRLYFPCGKVDNKQRRLEQLYHQALYKDLIWFDGSVLKTHRGNPSGWKNTTEDNCIRHLFIRWYHFTYTMQKGEDYFWDKVFLRVLSDDSICIADKDLLKEEDLNKSYTFWKTVYKGYVKPLTREISDTTYLGARFKRCSDGTLTYTIAKNKAFWSACVTEKLNREELRNKLESIAALLANDPDVLSQYLYFIEPYGFDINVEKARIIASGIDSVCTDFSHAGFSSGYTNFCYREAPSSGFKEIYQYPISDSLYSMGVSQEPPASSSSKVVPMADKRNKKQKPKKKKKKTRTLISSLEGKRSPPLPPKQLVRVKDEENRPSGAVMAALRRKYASYRPSPKNVKRITPISHLGKAVMVGTHDMLNFNRSLRLSQNYLTSLIPGSKRALSALRKIVGEGHVAFASIKTTPKGNVFSFHMVENSDNGYPESLDAGHPMRSGALELLDTSTSHSKFLSEPIHHSRKSMVKRLENELIEDELETNILSHLVIRSMLDPCEAPNVGFPDEENRGLSMKPKIRTVAVGGPDLEYLISRNPSRHIGFRGTNSRTYDSPDFSNASSTGNSAAWDVGTSSHSYISSPTGTSYLLNGGSSVFSVDALYDTDEDIGFYPILNHARLELLNYRTSDGADIRGFPSFPGDTVTVRFSTSLTTADGYRAFASFLLGNGQLSEQSVDVTGGAVVANLGSGTVTAPSDTVAFISYGVANKDAATSSFLYPIVKTTFNHQDAEVYVPIGNEAGDDIALLLQHANDVRTIGCRATATYIGEKLENGWVVGGQPPMPGDAERLTPTLKELATTLGLKPMALNGTSPGISFPIFPLTKEEMDFHPMSSLFDDNDFGEGIIRYKATSALDDVVILQTEMSIQARTERQSLMVTPGEVSLPAVSDVFTFIAENDLLSFVTGNEDHEEVVDEKVREFDQGHPTFSFFNGWFSGNKTTVKDIVA
jgi:hypothetical protein